MTTATIVAIRKNLSEPDISREFGKVRVDVVRLGDRPVARWTFKPGFDLSRDMKPYVDRAAIECTHVGYVIRGRLEVRTPDGSRIELRPGDCCRVGGDHEARVVGNEPFEVVDFGDVEELLKFLEPSGGRPETGPSEEEYVVGD